MAKAKSETRKLAEQIAKQRNIKVKSAYRVIERAATSEKVPSLSGLSGKVRAKVRAVREKVQYERVLESRLEAVEEFAEVERVDFDFDGTADLYAYGHFRMGTSGGKRADIRWRWARNDLADAQLVNDVLNAATIDDAAQIFVANTQYLSDVFQIDQFEFDGRTYGPDHFD